MKKSLFFLFTLACTSAFAQDCTPFINSSFVTPGIYPEPLIGSTAGIPYNDVSTLVLAKRVDNILTASPGDSLSLCDQIFLHVTGLPAGYTFEVWAIDTSTSLSYNVLAAPLHNIMLDQHNPVTHACVRWKNPNPPMSSNMSDGLLTRDTVIFNLLMGYVADQGSGCVDLQDSGGVDIIDIRLTIRDSLTSLSACDSQLVNDPGSLSSSQTLTICYGHQVTVGNNIYTESGTYYDTFPSINGCDSIVTTYLTVTPPPVFSQSPVICIGSSITVGPHTYSSSGTYSDTLTVANGCDSVVNTNLTVQDCSGIEEVHIFQLDLYPNPSNGIINLVSSVNKEKAVLEITNIMGQVVLSKNISIVQGEVYPVDCTSLPTGVYILRIDEVKQRMVKN